MECADGVCKFVPRSQRGVHIGGNEENVEPALPPVSVGDKPPMPLIFETLEEGGASVCNVCARQGRMEVEWWCWVSQPLHREDGGGE